MLGFKNSKENAFTLAEMLITITIVGVIASLTISVVIKKYQEMQTVIKLNKAYKALSYATRMSTIKNGPIEALDVKDHDLASIEKVFLAYQPFLPIVRSCKNTQGCWTKENTKWLTGGEIGNTIGVLCNQVYSFVLNNDMRFIIDAWDVGSGKTNFGLTSKMNYILIFIVDINGDKKPNTFGRDVFIFTLTEKALLPAGYFNDSVHCKTTSTGLDCAAKVLKENAVKY